MAVVNVDVGSVITGLMGGLDNLFTSDEEREQAKLALQETLQKPHMMQAMAMLNESKSTNWFVAGGRPALLWLCAFCLAYHWMLKDFIVMGSVLAGVSKDTIALLPVIDGGEITGLVFTLLGLGGLRTYEKVHKVAREQ